MSWHIRQHGLGRKGLKMSAATPQRRHCQSVSGPKWASQGPPVMPRSIRWASAAAAWRGQQATGGCAPRQVTSVDLRRRILTAVLVLTCGALAGAVAGGAEAGGEGPLLACTVAGDSQAGGEGRLFACTLPSEPLWELLELLWLRMSPCSVAAGVPFQSCCTTGLGSGADVWGGSRCRGTRGAMSVNSRTPRMWPCRSLRSLKGTEKSSTATLVPELSRSRVEDVCVRRGLAPRLHAAGEVLAVPLRVHQFV